MRRAQARLKPRRRTLSRAADLKPSQAGSPVWETSGLHTGTIFIYRESLWKDLQGSAFLHGSPYLGELHLSNKDADQGLGPNMQDLSREAGRTRSISGGHVWMADAKLIDSILEAAPAQGLSPSFRPWGSPSQYFCRDPGGPPAPRFRRQWRLPPLRVPGVWAQKDNFPCRKLGVAGMPHSLRRRGAHAEVRVMLTTRCQSLALRSEFFSHVLQNGSSARDSARAPLRQPYAQKACSRCSCAHSDPRAPEHLEVLPDL